MVCSEDGVLDEFCGPGRQSSMVKLCGDPCVPIDTGGWAWAAEETRSPELGVAHRATELREGIAPRECKGVQDLLVGRRLVASESSVTVDAGERAPVRGVRAVGECAVQQTVETVAAVVVLAGAGVSEVGIDGPVVVLAFDGASDGGDVLWKRTGGTPLLERGVGAVACGMAL